MNLLAQLLVTAVVVAATYTILALGFGLILNVTGTFHFAHAAVYALAGFLVYTLAEHWKLNFWLSLVIAAVICVALALAMETWIYQPLRLRSATSLTLLIASLGLQIFLENLVSATWGTTGLYVPVPFKNNIHNLGKGYFTDLDVLTVTIAAVLAVGLLVLWKYTRLGKAMQAYSDNPVMAGVVGVDGRVVVRWAFVIGTALVVPVATITGMNIGLLPWMGTLPLLLATAAVIVGGIGSMSGAVVGGVLLALIQGLVTWKLPAYWGEIVAFLVLVLFILFKPTGFFGKRLAGRHVR